MDNIKRGGPGHIVVKNIPRDSQINGLGAGGLTHEANSRTIV